MFDATYMNPTRTEYVTKTVNEHRAPTDDSVKILREMEAAARNEVFNTVRVENNNLNAVFHFMNDVLSCDIRCHIQIKLNHKEVRKEIRISDFLSQEEKLEKLYSTVCEIIALECLRAADFSKYFK